jgi:2-methylcitrate dehydratase PrpD
MTLAEQLARHFASLGDDRIPEHTTADAKQLVLDYLGVAIAGSQPESGRIGREFSA